MKTHILYSYIEKNQLWEGSISLKRNEYLKIGGNVDTNTYFVISGSLKLSIMEEEDEYIIRFGYQNDFINALDSFITEKPSDFYIEALKRTELKYISKSTLMNLVDNHTELKELWIKLLENLIVQQIEREKDILISSPIQRYQRVLQRSPQLFQEIPHKYIASYLRMSPETLSRLIKS